MKYLIIIMALMLAACAPSPSKTSSEDAKHLVDGMTFVRSSKVDACFGVLQTSRINSSGQFSLSVSVTQVDCALVHKGQ